MVCAFYLLSYLADPLHITHDANVCCAFHWSWNCKMRIFGNFFTFNFDLKCVHVIGIFKLILDLSVWQSLNIGIGISSGYVTLYNFGFVTIANFYFWQSFVKHCNSVFGVTSDLPAQYLLVFYQSIWSLPHITPILWKYVICLIFFMKFENKITHYELPVCFC